MSDPRVFCGHCGLPFVSAGLNNPHCRCQLVYQPRPPMPGAVPSRFMTEDDVRRIVREELARDLEERRTKMRAFVAEVHGVGNPAGDPITDSRCEYLYPPLGRCDKCGNVHDGKPPVVNFPAHSQEAA